MARATPQIRLWHDDSSTSGFLEVDAPVGPILNDPDRRARIVADVIPIQTIEQKVRGITHIQAADWRSRR